MMVKVLLYGYCTGVVSSRRMAEALEVDVAFRYLAANQQPDFRTLSDFRKEHREALEGLFVEILRLCREAGLTKMGRVALDGRGGGRQCGVGSEPYARAVGKGDQPAGEAHAL